MFGCGVVLVGLFATADADCEIIQLKDGGVITGKILSLFEDGYIVRSLEQDRLVRKSDIALIRYDDVEKKIEGGDAEGGGDKVKDSSAVKAKPQSQSQGEAVFGREHAYLLDLPYAFEREIDPRFSTPLNTFKTWKNAAGHGRIEEIVRCYSQSFQEMIYESLKNMTEEQVDAMVRETRSTEFRIERIVFKGKMAFARVARKRADFNDEDVLNFVKENGLWKLIP